MARLVYTTFTSLDGYTVDEAGSFDWATPDEEVFAFVNVLERDVGTYLLGRKMYETMVYWETFEFTSDTSGAEKDFTAMWRAADKVVFSQTLGEAPWPRTRIVREFDPVEVRRVIEAADADVTIGGPGLASQAMADGLVDEVHLLVTPVSVGGGTPAIPRHQRHAFELHGVDRFAGGVVHLHYRVIH